MGIGEIREGFEGQMIVGGFVPCDFCFLDELFLKK